MKRLRLLKRSWPVGILAASWVMSGCELSPLDGSSKEDSAGEIAVEPAPPALRRLLGRQYQNSIHTLLGEDAALVVEPPTDTAINGFEAVAASQLALDDATVARYESNAQAAAVAAMGDAKRISDYLACDPNKESDATCYESFVVRLGRVAFRRPLTPDEVDDYVGLARRGKEQLGDFYAGLQFVITAMLQSPHFLYQVEIGTPSEDGKSARLTSYELLTRMSFFLLDTSPDETMLDAVEGGALDSVDGVRTAAREMLARPEARDATHHFFGEYLALKDVHEMSKDQSTYSAFSPELAASMQQETIRLVDDIVWVRDADFRELFTADYTFVDEKLAALYDIDEAKGLSPGSWMKVDVPEGQKRGGILGHASILARQSHATSTSPTHRGLFVMQRFMCRAVLAPPPDVDTTLPESSKAPTMRERLAVHLEEPSCSTCHAVMDTIGLGLENFSGIGAFRKTENGELIDALVDVPSFGEFDGAAQLGAMLSASSETTRCVVRNLFRHATGHVETEGELDALEALDAEFAGSNHRFQELMVSLVANPAFRNVGVVDASTDASEGGE